MGYLLALPHYEPLNCLVSKSALCSLSKKLVVSSAPDQCLVLWACILGQNFCGPFFMGYLLAFPALWTLELSGVQKFAKKCAKKFSDLHQDNLTHFGFSGLEQIFWGCVCLFGGGGGGGGELKHGRFLKITLTYSRLLSLISQKFNNATHWNFAWSKAAKEHKNIILLEKSKPTNSRTQEVNDIEILTEVCSSNRKYLLKVWSQLFVPFLSAFAKEHQNIKYI